MHAVVPVWCPRGPRRCQERRPAREQPAALAGASRKRHRAPVSVLLPVFTAAHLHSSLPFIFFAQMPSRTASEAGAVGSEGTTLEQGTLYQIMFRQYFQLVKCNKLALEFFLEILFRQNSS